MARRKSATSDGIVLVRLLVLDLKRARTTVGAINANAARTASSSGVHRTWRFVAVASLASLGSSTPGRR